MKSIRLAGLSVAVGLLFFGHDAAAQSAPPAPHVAKYLGPGSCAAAACHGAIAPQKTSTVNQNEYSIWVVQDRHASAFRVLQNPVSQRMGKLLGIGKPEQSPKCLICHALYVPGAEKGRKIDLSDGVSCENCHGPSSAWLGSHTTKGWTRQKSVNLGMVNNWDVVKRTEQCVTCHMGDDDRSVDHEMIAAGHPDLVFDLESYSAAMPPHWKVEDDASSVLSNLMIGQAVELREALSRLNRRATSGTWPEYAEFECYACHHELLRAESSWRQKAGYAQRKPGNPPWNAAHFAVLRLIAKQVEPETSAALESKLANVFKVTSDVRSSRDDVARVAGESSDIAEKTVQSLRARKLTQDDARRILTALVGQSDTLANAGPKTAEQATLALQSLAAVGKPAGTTEPGGKEFQTALKALYRELQSPSTYQAGPFAEHFRQAAATLR